ncbi:hypothetical protein ACFWGN_20715 [Oerskovia sp. NPDC060338]|uniref:hypothetical protein n=1 Tax=Oerskovia sp. NPDC060338 TaxID=3347100 RepID=UPI003659A8CB
MTPTIGTLLGILAVQVFMTVRLWLSQRTTEKTIDHEMKPNHGSSMRDAIDRIERGQERQAERLDRHIEHCDR